VKIADSFLIDIDMPKNEHNISDASHRMKQLPDGASLVQATLAASPAEPGELSGGFRPFTMRKVILSSLVAVTILFGQAGAVQITHQSLDEVLLESEIALMVEIGSVSEPVKESFFVHVDFDARPLKTIFGSLKSCESLLLTYSQGMPHYREDTAISPLVSGSGLEFNLKKSDRVIVLLKAKNSCVERLPVLRVEPLTQLKVIQQKKKV
jgi:hypothetical protein